MNIMETAVIMQRELDKAAEQQLMTGWMEANASNAKYAGGNDIRIPILTMDGMADYDRTEGFNRGAVNLRYQTKEMTQDRGRSFMLDSMDIDDSGFAASASAVAGEFQRLHVVPEIDAYRISKLYAYADTRKRTLAVTESNVLRELGKDVDTVREKMGSATPIRIHMSFHIWSILKNTEKLMRMLDVTDFARGDIMTKVRSLDGDPILVMNSDRMKTGYDFFKGLADSATDKKAGGFAPKADAATLNWLIVAANSPIAVSKTDKVRIFEPVVNQGADAWKVDYRTYHDLWVTENKLDGLFANVAP